MAIYQLPLQTFPSDLTDQIINVSIENTAYIFYFQKNVIDDTLYLSVYGSNQSPIYFGSYRCVLGTYINNVDNGFDWLVYFVNTSTTNFYENITFEALNNGVNLYVKSRS